ncbi:MULTISPECIES: cutinase family protein [Mycobacterium]|uniref:Cutinase n=1 Tax=Mycobacterium syngnathidarum TaxID=1908205 RepID=A0A1Q9W3L3_9MYCO|nr:MULTISPECIES: cutinase family protein [Mycobacterium]MCG7606597.1 cutinase family protein [Mycobacterium sp. CnD-18-1]OHU05778.1 cutinase [Mycobacterium syngnathidarum]OLT87988.1 cutinase [Mycobacterium syngnathidarum]TMS54903.1 cutinase family protein [Mycobacterium sp. DBP42]
MFRRIVALVGAGAVASAALIGLAGPAAASPGCPDLHWIGVAGSGERDDPTVDAGMGRVVYNSLRDLSQWVQQDGRTMSAEAVAYPAAPVPADGDLLGWGGFMSSVDTGVAALGNQYAAFTQRCPSSQVILAGYSQGAMVVHRNLAGLSGSPNLAAALLVADGDRLPADPTVNLGTATAVPGAGKGVAQDWPILAHAPAPLTATIGSRTISVCDRGDAVCDYDEDAEEVTATAIAVHTSYARSSSGGYRWTWPLYRMLGPAPMQQQTVPTAVATDGVVHS